MLCVTTSVLTRRPFRYNGIAKPLHVVLSMHSLTDPLFGHSTQTLASSLGSGGANGGFNPLYQIGGPRSIQLALKLQF